jgi:two-component system, NarL family, nitrate/nitrite response regulator NarL
MLRAIAAVIVARAGPFRDALESNLRPPAFRIVASKASLSDISRGELPGSDPCLVVIECGESPGPFTGQIAELKQQNPLARVALVGQHWMPADIATAFEAGVNAYFAEAAVSKEFLQALNLITR